MRRAGDWGCRSGQVGPMLVCPAASISPVEEAAWSPSSGWSFDPIRRGLRKPNP